MTHHIQGTMVRIMASSSSEAMETQILEWYIQHAKKNGQ